MMLVRLGCIVQRCSYSTFTPRRAVLYVPGDDPKKINKATGLRADCVVLDCEDGVALNKKEEARSSILDSINNENLRWNGSEVSVRVNSVDSGLCEQDLGAVLSGKHLPLTLLLPKVDSVRQLDWFSEKLSTSVGRSICRQFNLIFYTESARSLLDLPLICERAQELAKRALFKPVGIVFGSDDYCADIEATRTLEATELMYARQKIVTVAKAYSLQAIDLVHIDYKDLDGCRKQAEEGFRMGFTGKQVIHPSQIDIVQASFTPSLEKQKWAEELVAEFQQHQQGGKGAFTFRGHMIDKPLLLQAQNVLALAESVSRNKATQLDEALAIAEAVRRDKDQKSQK